MLCDIFFTVSVIHAADETGTYQIPTWDAAAKQCAILGMRLATRDQLKEAWKQGLDVCACGWLADSTVGFPIVKPRDGCGGPTVGVRTCSSETGGGGGWDAYCTDSDRMCTLVCY
jgi:hypothetical protein